MNHTAWIGLGSNLGDRLLNIFAGLSGLSELGSITGIGGLYETDPLDYLDQGAFFNTAVCLETDLNPCDLLSCLKKIEIQNGRIGQIVAKGPRTLDLDILLYDDSVFVSESLTIPHSSLKSRKFALLPLLDIDPCLKLPQSPERLRDFLPGLESQGVYLLSSSWYND